MRDGKVAGLRVSMRRLGLAAGLIAVLATGAVAGDKKDAPKASVIENLQPYLDATGFVATYNTNGNIDTTGPFFQSLGTNGRSCSTCHVASQAMSFSALGAQLRFIETRGTDPLFAAVDGANCPTARTADPMARSLVLGSGLIRIPMTTPATSQFSVSAAYDPYGCAIDTSTGSQSLSFYRRPLPTTNLRYLSAVMFDGRESATYPLGTPATFATNLNTDLTAQALHAVQQHTQSVVDPTPAQLAAIVNLEMGFTTAQAYDFSAGLLQSNGAQGGPLVLAQQAYYPGMNDSLTPPIFSPIIFTLYSNWTTQPGHSIESRAREQIAAGELLFNSFPINIVNVRGINDNAALGKPAVVTGTCGTCHDAPNVGDHSLPLPLDIGTGHSPAYETDPQIKAALAELSVPKLPVYQVTGCSDPFSGSTTIYTTDLGKAMLTGQCGDLNRVKGPILRGLAARAPYFHNGAAANLKQLVNFYNQRFAMGLTEQQKAQLVAFLNTL